MISISWKDATGFQELRASKVGRKILSRTLSKTAISGKAEGKRRILEVYTVKSTKIKLFAKPASPSRLLAEVGARSTDQRGKKAIPLHEFKFNWNRPKGRKIRKGDPPLRGEIIRGEVTAWKGGFSALGRNSGKIVAIRRKGEARYPTTSLTGPSAGAMFMNPRVIDHVLKRLEDRLPTVMEQETRFAMDYESDKGKEVSTDDVDA